MAANGFVEQFYMTNYCWENMIHYPAKEINYSSTNLVDKDSGIPIIQSIMVYDDKKSDLIENLRYAKHTMLV